MIRTPRGFLFESSTPGDLRFLCNEAVGIADGEDASFAALNGTALLMATYSKGVVWGNPDACGWAPVAAVSTAPAFDVVTAGPDATAFVVGGTPHTGDHFWAGRDGAMAWSALANTDIPYTRVRVAASAPQRVYLSGIGLGDGGALIHRLAVSDDGGATITELTIPLGATDLQALVLDVDPTRPDHVYVRVESNSEQIPERLLVSNDAGRTFTPGPMLLDIQGFAQSNDGLRVWVGGKEGIFRSDDGGLSFTSSPSAAMTSITCLAFHRDHLYACGVLDNQLVVAESDDGGGSFRKLFSFDQVREAVDCPGLAPTQTPATVCAGSLEHWRSELGTLDPTPTGGAAGGSGSAGAPGNTGGQSGSTPPSQVGSSGCQVSGTRGDARGGPLAAVIALLLFRGRTRRRDYRRRSDGTSIGGSGACGTTVASPR